MTNPNDPIISGDKHYPPITLTKREYFAAMAMQAILSEQKYHKWTRDQYARESVACADALIEALNK